MTFFGIRMDTISDAVTCPDEEWDSYADPNDMPDDPDMWRDHAEDDETTREERADFEGWPVI